ncbi:MAG: type II secretion system protein GspK, partial [Thioalkalispiraceae bacterium]
GSEDEEYLHKNYPYLAANQLMVDVSELRVINGFSAAITAKLISHITVLPTYTELNINTAEKALLMSLDSHIDSTIADAIMDYRKTNSFKNKLEFIDFVEKLLDRETRTSSTIDRLLGVSSNYFMVNSMVNIDQARSILQSTVHRTILGKISVIKRRRGML